MDGGRYCVSTVRGMPIPLRSLLNSEFRVGTTQNRKEKENTKK